MVMELLVLSEVKAPSFLSREREEFDAAVSNAFSISLLQQIKKQITKNLQGFSSNEKEVRKSTINARIVELQKAINVEDIVEDIDSISGKRWDTAGGKDNARAKRFEHFTEGDNVWCKVHGIGKYAGASNDQALVVIGDKAIEVDILSLHVIELEEKYALLQPRISVLILNKNFGECGEVAKVEQNQLTIAEPIAEKPQMHLKWNNAVLTRSSFINNTQLYNRAHLIAEGDEVEWIKGSGRVLSISPTVKIKWEYRDDAMEYCAEDLFKMKVSPKLIIKDFEPNTPQAEVVAPTQEKVAVKTGQLQVPLSAIIEDLSTQSREQINKETVDEYARERKAGVDLPPIIAFTDGIQYWIADGWHRYYAEKLIEGSHIVADVREGTQRDAILYSVGANANHGLRRSNADKRKSVVTLLKDEEWCQWSNRQIGRRCGVDEGMVRKYRQELSTDNPQTDRLVQRNGASYTQKTGNIGKKEVFPRQAVISADCPNVELRGKQVTVTCKPNASTYIVDAGTGQAPPPIDKKFIVELPKSTKPVISIKQETKAVAESLGVPASGLPEIPRNDGINPNYEKLAKLNAAVNDVVDGASALTDGQISKLLGAVNLDMVSDDDLRLLTRRINQALISRSRAEAA
jgi:hypothetical protein